MEKPLDQKTTQKRSPYLTSFLNRIGGIFLAPDATFSQMAAKGASFWEPLTLVILLVVIQGAVVASFTQRLFSAVANAVSAFTSGTLGFGVLSFILAAVVFAAIVGTLILWVILAGIAHLSARYVFRGTGSFVSLMKMYGYTLIPTSLVILGTVLLSISWGMWPLALFFNIITMFWIVLLMTLAVRHNYKIDTGKAFISSFIGPMTVWLTIVAVTWAWIWLMLRSYAGGLF